MILLFYFKNTTNRNKNSPKKVTKPSFEMLMSLSDPLRDVNINHALDI